ncbi:hypothetical protein QQP08_013469 [Theobroma cacao]|nr:hypothetical protein QQP08_013469 [Theobroma cacao]
MVNLGFVTDARSHLNPPIPKNYFGNCVLGLLASAKVGNFMDENGFATVAELASDTPRKVEIVSIDRGGAISLAKSKDGSAVIEIGFALNKHEMKTFASLFLDGLRDL